MASPEVDSSPGDSLQASQTDRDFLNYLPLYKAAITGNWNNAQLLFDEDEESRTAAITSFGETVLHVAARSHKAKYFVNNLVDSMSIDELAGKDSYGETALHNAAQVGNTELARAMVAKNPALLSMRSESGDLAVNIAAENCKKKTIQFLISASAPDEENPPFQGECGLKLLISLITWESFDVALDLVQRYPECRARSGDALLVMAGMGTVFPSGEIFSWWEKLIYRRIPVNEPSEARSVGAEDVENRIGDNEARNRCSTTWFRIIFCPVWHKFLFPFWKVHQVITKIKEKKTKHKQALKLVKYLCEQIPVLPEDNWSFLGKSITLAAGNGISEIVELIINMYPVVTATDDCCGHGNMMHLAAKNRFENVFNLIYSMSYCEHFSTEYVDGEGNNLMHMCAMLAPPHRLSLVRGAALQMQRELQWFNETKKSVPPAQRNRPNKKGETPQMLFTEEHKQLKADGEKWMKDTANACTIAAALIATVVFAAAFTVPGGMASETGIPVFSHEPAFVLFAIADAVSLYTSVSSLLMFLFILSSRYAEGDFLYVLPRRLSIGLSFLFVSITFMLVAFSAALFLVFRRQEGWFLIPVAAFAWLPAALFLLSQTPLLVDIVCSTYGPGIFGKKKPIGSLFMDFGNCN